MSYKGKYTPVNKDKYEGDPSNVVYRSLWERQVFKWCDTNPDVIKWGSETVVVPYICKTDGKRHRYFTDLKIKFVNHKTLLVEIKPKKQTMAPTATTRKTRKHLTEVLTYAKNQSKWAAADEFAKERNWEFQIWTEDTLSNMGIPMVKGPRALANERKRNRKKCLR